MNEKKLVAVHGSYFVNNFGDTLLVKMLCDKISGLVGRDNVFLAVAAHEEEQNSIGYPVLPISKRAKVSHLVYSGGGYFGEPNENILGKIKWSIRNYKRHLKWVSDFSAARIGIFGVGLGPISIGIYRNAVKQLFARSNVILVRDVESLEFVKKYKFSISNVYQCVDLALSLRRSALSGREGLAIHVGDLNEREIRIILLSIQQMKSLSELNNIDVLFDNPGMYKEKILAKYRKAAESADFKGRLNFLPYSGCEAMIDRLNSYGLVLTSKLHVGIVTIALGGRCISIPAHQKTSRLYKQLRIDKFCVERKDLSVEVLADKIKVIHTFSPDLSQIQKGMDLYTSKLNDYLK
jgi:polysaccharide pyruvyl transferase WcaK-like protein